MTSISKVAASGRWRARYRDEDGKQHARHFDRKVEAQRWLNDVTASVVRGDYVEPGAGKVTVAAYAATWQAVQVSSPGTARIVDNAVRCHLLPELGAKPMASVLPSTIQGFVKTLEAKGLAAGTIRNVHDVAWRVFDAAVHDRVISRSPFVKIKLPALEKHEVVVPTIEEVAALADAVDDRWRAVIVTLAGSGLRIGELLGLQVRDVDFLKRTIRVERQRTQDGLLTPPKSASSIRTVPVGQVVINELAAHLARHPSTTDVFRDEFGKPLQYRRWKHIWAGASREAQVSFTSHAMRHFFASALISGGASVKQVQTVLGHASAVITLKVYSHLWPGDEDRTRVVMDAALMSLEQTLDASREALEH